MEFVLEQLQLKPCLFWCPELWLRVLCYVVSNISKECAACLRLPFSRPCRLLCLHRKHRVDL